MVHGHQRLSPPHQQRTDRKQAWHTDHPSARNHRAENGTAARDPDCVFPSRREIFDRRVQLGEGQTRGLVFESATEKPASDITSKWKKDSCRSPRRAGRGIRAPVEIRYRTTPTLFTLPGNDLTSYSDCCVSAD